MSYYSKIGIELGGITESLNDKADRDMRNIDTISGADTVIEYRLPTAANNYTWYRKYKSGWVEQGGLTQNGVTNYTLPVTMSDTNYYVSGTWNGGKSATFYPSDWACYPVSTSKIFCNAKDNTNVKSYAWEVKGIAA